MSHADRVVAPVSAVADEAAQRGPVELDLSLLRHVSGGSQLPKESWRAAMVTPPDQHVEGDLPKEAW